MDIHTQWLITPSKSLLIVIFVFYPYPIFLPFKVVPNITARLTQQSSIKWYILVKLSSPKDNFKIGSSPQQEKVWAPLI